MYVHMPNGYVIFLDGNQDFQGRLDTINKLVFNYNNGQWMEWLEQMWLNERKSFGQSMNITENILDRLGTFLLTGNFRDGKILTAEKEEKIRVQELPISCTSGNNIEDFFYANTGQDDSVHGFMYVAVSPVLSNSNYVKPIYDMKNKDIEKETNKQEQSKKKWKESKTAKINELYTTKKLDTYRVVATGKKDLQGKPIIDTKAVHIGHDGVINGSYVACWCLVDTENIFRFMNNQYRISNDVKEYRVGEDNRCEMERVLVYYLPASNTYLYFDESIQPINENEIIKL